MFVFLSLQTFCCSTSVLLWLLSDVKRTTINRILAVTAISVQKVASNLLLFGARSSGVRTNTVTPSVGTSTSFFEDDIAISRGSALVSAPTENAVTLLQLEGAGNSDCTGCTNLFSEDSEHEDGTRRTMLLEDFCVLCPCLSRIYLRL